VLDLDTLIEKSHTREETDKVRYRGPFYIDWDGSNSDLDTVIGKVRQFIGVMEENEVDLDSISWYASGRLPRRDPAGRLYAEAAEDRRAGASADLS
jgi:hypothetical protein